MPQLIKPKEVQVVTKEGECTVNIQLELTIKLDGTGLQIGSVSAQGVQKEKEPEVKTNWQIPDFSGGPKLKFGKES